MAKCKNCGAKLRSPSGFCQECGTQNSSGKKSGGEGSSSVSGMFWVYVILAILIVVGVFYGVNRLLPKSEITGDVEFHYFSNTPNSVESLKLDIDIADIVLLYNTTPVEEIVKINASIDFAGRSISAENLTELCTFTWDNSSDLKSLTLQYNIDGNLGYSDLSQIVVLLRTDLIYNLTVISNDGKVSLNFPQDTTCSEINIKSTSNLVELDFKPGFKVLKNITLDSTSGDIELSANNTYFQGGITIDNKFGDIIFSSYSCSFGGDFKYQALAGHQNLTIINPVYSTNVKWTIIGGTADIDLHVIQKIACENNVIATILNGNGKINFNFEAVEVSLGVEIVSYTQKGEISFTDMGGFNQIINNTYAASSTLPSDNYAFILTTVQGDISIIGKFE